MEIQSDQPVTNFTLIGPNEQPVSLVDFRDKVVMLYFGYTFALMFVRQPWWNYETPWKSWGTVVKMFKSSW